MLRDFGIVTVVDLTRLPARRDDRAAGGADVGRAARAVPVRDLSALWRRRSARSRGRRERGPLRGPGRRAAPGRASASASPSATAPTPSRRRPEGPRPGNKYAWAVGIVVVMVLSVLLFFADAAEQRARASAGPSRDASAQGLRRAVALGTSRATPTSARREPLHRPGRRGARLHAHSAEVVNVCDLRRRPLVLTFIFDRGADCYPQVDRTERVMGSLPGVNFATVFFTHKERDEVRGLVEARGWRQPVAVDQDGAVANLYGVGGCPTTDLRPRRRQGRDDQARQPDRGPAAPHGDADRGLMELQLAEGWVEPELAEEFPELRLVHAAGRRPPAAAARARSSERLRGAGRPLHRRQGDPHAPGRRALGLPRVLAPGGDRPRHRPDAGRGDRRSSACATAASRARTSLDDALTIAIAETGVPVLALDADQRDRRAGTAAGPAGRGAGRRAAAVGAPARRGRRGPTGGDRARRGRPTTPGVTPGTERMLLCALRVKGVPPIAVEEALWIAAETLYT